MFGIVLLYRWSFLGSATRCRRGRGGWDVVRNPDRNHTRNFGGETQDRPKGKQLASAEQENGDAEYKCVWAGPPVELACMEELACRRSDFAHGDVLLPGRPLGPS
jgi:hypothetical protein